MIIYYHLFRYYKTSEVNTISLSFSCTDHPQKNNLVTLHTILKSKANRQNFGSLPNTV